METEIKEQKLFKIVDESGHHGLIYKEGWNIDPLPFNPTGDCEAGGIYFSGRDILSFLEYGKSVYEVTNYSTPYENPGTQKKYKAHEVELKYIGEWKNVEVMKYLIENGADVHADNDVALSCSAEMGHLEVVKYLIENGADIHACNGCALRCSARRGHVDIVKYLIENGANIHAWDEYALRSSANNGHFEVVKYLIEQGADVHAAIKYLKILGDFNTVSTLEKFL